MEQVADFLFVLRRKLKPWLRYAVLLPAFLWMAVFFLFPFLIIFKISFSETILASPPFSQIFNVVEEFGNWYLDARLNLTNYLTLFEDTLYISAYLTSLKVALISTFLCLLLAFPMAYAIAKTPKRWQSSLLILVILPFWTSFLIRVYSWIGILKNDGLLNALLMNLGVIQEPLVILNTDWALYIGVVYSYLPFMILPIYTSLEKMDPTLLEAAHDLGCKPIRAFWKIVVPLARPGILAGALLVFIPVTGEFVIPDLLGNSQNMMIGQVIWIEFFSNSNWPISAAIAMVLLLFLVIPIVLFQRLQFSRHQSVNDQPGAR